MASGKSLESGNAQRTAAIWRALLQYPTASIWVESDGTITAGQAPGGDLNTFIVADEARTKFTVHAALPKTDVLAEWRQSTWREGAILGFFTVAFLVLAKLLADALRRRATSEREAAAAEERATQLAHYQVQLEETVAQRTLELKDANGQLHTELVERKDRRGGAARARRAAQGGDKERGRAARRAQLRQRHPNGSGDDRPDGHGEPSLYQHGRRRRERSPAVPAHSRMGGARTDVALVEQDIRRFRSDRLSSPTLWRLPCPAATASVFAEEVDGPLRRALQGGGNSLASPGPGDDWWPALGELELCRRGRGAAAVELGRNRHPYDASRSYRRRGGAGALREGIGRRQCDRPEQPDNSLPTARRAFAADDLCLAQHHQIRPHARGAARRRQLGAVPYSP